MEKSFYLSLCSTDSLDTYPSNSCDSFTNHLAQPLELSQNDSGGWEVAISEMHYTNSLQTVPKNASFGIFDLLYEWDSREVMMGDGLSSIVDLESFLGGSSCARTSPVLGSNDVKYDIYLLSPTCSVSVTPPICNMYLRQKYNFRALQDFFVLNVSK